MTCPAAHDTYFEVGGFRVNDAFLFKMEPPMEIAQEIRGATGAMHVYSQYWKEIFSVVFNLLTQDQYNQLMQILMVTGHGALLTATYATPELIRIWDTDESTPGTPPGYITNTDVNRVRRKVRVRSIDGPHRQGFANAYTVTVQFEEG